MQTKKCLYFREDHFVFFWLLSLLTRSHFAFVTSYSLFLRASLISERVGRLAILEEIWTKKLKVQKQKDKISIFPSSLIRWIDEQRQQGYRTSSLKKFAMWVMKREPSPHSQSFTRAHKSQSKTKIEENQSPTSTSEVRPPKLGERIEIPTLYRYNGMKERESIDRDIERACALSREGFRVQTGEEPFLYLC